MKPTLKLWLGVGVATVVQASELPRLAHLPTVPPAFADDEGGEGGASAGADEGGEGGEAGAGLPTTYALASTDPKAFDYDAKPQIEHYAAHVHTAYAEAAQGAKALQAAIDAMLADPTDATLASARKAWVDARPAYLRTEVFRFSDGPIEAIEGRINAWPMNEAYLDYVQGQPDAGLINDPKFELTLAEIDEYDQKQDEADVTTGWHAIEFLLWGQDLSADGPGNRPASDYIAGQGNNDRRRTYLQLVTQQLTADLASLEAAWAPGVDDNAAARFLALPQREALGRIVNGMAILAGYELMSERLAVALDSGDQEDEHSCFSDTTKADFVNDLAGIAAVWTGGGTGPGLDVLAESRDPALRKLVDQRFAAAESAIAKLGDPWDRVLASPPDSPQRQDAEAAVTALAELGAGLKQVGNKLGVLVLIPSES